MTQFEVAAIDLGSCPELVKRLDAFKRRANDLLAFIRTQDWGAHFMRIDRTNQEKPLIIGSIPDDLALEGLYRRFRFFILHKEMAFYYRFNRLLSVSSDDELLHRFLRVEKREFLQSKLLDYAFVTSTMKYRGEDVVDFWFNAYYFHDREEERMKLAKFEQVVSSEGAKAILWQLVWDSTLKIRNMSYLIRDTTMDNPVMYVPVSCSV